MQPFKNYADKESKKQKIKNMKNLFKLTLVAAVVAGSMFTSCKKEVITNGAQDPTELEYAALNNQTETDISEDDVTADEATGEMSIIGEGLSADFLMEAEDMDEVQGPAGGTRDSLNLRDFVRRRSLIKCLHGLNLTDTQKHDIRKAIIAQKNCRESAVTRARAIYHDIKAGYAKKYTEILAQLKNGKITRAQANDRITALRKAFVADLRIAHLNEKLGMALRTCHIKFLRSLHDTLTTEQWRAFVACHRK